MPIPAPNHGIVWSAVNNRYTNKFKYSSGSNGRKFITAVF